MAKQYLGNVFAVSCSRAVQGGAQSDGFGTAVIVCSPNTQPDFHRRGAASV